MKELLREWKRFLLEQSGNPESTIDPKTGDVILSDDAYAAFVFWRFNRLYGIKSTGVPEYIKSRKLLFPYSQYDSASSEAYDLHNLFFNILKLIQDKRMRKKIVQPYDSNKKYHTIQNIIHKRAKLAASISGNPDLEYLAFNVYSLKIHDFFSSRNKFDPAKGWLVVDIPSIRDYKKDPQKFEAELKAIDEQSRGAAELLNRLKLYKKLLEVDDPEIKQTFLESFVLGITGAPENLAQLESFLDTLY